MKHNTTTTFPQKIFQASQQRQLVLVYLDSPIESTLITLAVGIVTLALGRIHPSAYVNLQDLLARLSLIPQVETLAQTIHTLVQTRALEMQLSEDSEAPITDRATLPNLHWFILR